MLNPPSFMTTFIAGAKARLQQLYATEEAAAVVDWWLEAFFGKGRLREMQRNGGVPSTSEQTELDAQLDQLCKGVPLQQLLGKAYFLDFELYINEHVLIPRPETEELVDLVRKAYSRNAALKILDVGTGSGCIALGLAKHFVHSSLMAVDVSAEALAVARKNGAALDLEVDFVEQDMLAGGPQETFDVVVSNPPYITSSEREDMHTNVLAHEPHTALFAPDEDPLLFYRAIRNYALTHVKSGGKVFLEVNRAWAEETAMLFQEVFEVSVLRDMQGNNRFVVGVKK